VHFNVFALSAICIPSSVEIIAAQSFYQCAGLSTVAFERDSHLARIGPHAFRGCSSLSSISVPSSVEVICEHCFYDCAELSAITFESGSALSTIALSALQWCPLLASICIPSSLRNVFSGFGPIVKVCVTEQEESAPEHSEKWRNSQSDSRLECDLFSFCSFD
jgi:hypothetical protein